MDIAHGTQKVIVSLYGLAPKWFAKHAVVTTDCLGIVRPIALVSKLHGLAQLTVLIFYGKMYVIAHEAIRMEAKSKLVLRLRKILKVLFAVIVITK